MLPTDSKAAYFKGQLLGNNSRSLYLYVLSLSFLDAMTTARHRILEMIDHSSDPAGLQLLFFKNEIGREVIFLPLRRKIKDNPSQITVLLLQHQSHLLFLSTTCVLYHVKHFYTEVTKRGSV